MVINDRPRKSGFLLSQREGGLQSGQAPVGLMNNQLRAHFGYHEELAFSEFGGVAAEEICVKGVSLTRVKNDMKIYQATMSALRSQQV